MLHINKSPQITNDCQWRFPCNFKHHIHVCLGLDDEVDEGSEEEERQEAAQQQQQPGHQAPDRHQQAAVRGPHPQEHRHLSIYSV